MSSRRRDDRDDRDRRSARRPSPPRKRDSRSRSRSPRRADTRRQDRNDERDRRERPRDQDRDRRRSRSPPRRDDRNRDRRRSRSPPRRDGDRDRRREHSPPRFERARGPTGPREASRERGDSQPPPTQPAGKAGRARAVDLMDDPPHHSDLLAPANGDSRMEEGEDEQDDDAQMMAMMGFAGFDSTKGKGMEGNQDGGVDIKKRRTWRQYMNRRGGFNRPLDRVK
ncbi:hypothetical protein BKA62DRAFT_694965 [Auriculariales sp. MPI-PUGE-AT-0066]|nr:hypothetical protein BKA62DRAFT_694965 [Auriculariales sp. MPI-PUGE-AT-0066]